MQRLRPKISVMSGRQIGRVHDQSLHILATVGLEIDSEKAVEIFKGAGAEVDGSRVRIPADLVQWALDVAPSSVDIYDRRGNPAFRIGDGSETRFGIGVTALQYQDPMTDEISPFQRSHMKKMVRLGQTLPSFDVISTVGIIQDIGPETADLYATLEMVANGTKPLVVLVSQEDLFPAVLDLLEHLHGDLASKPFVIPYFNPVTPLIINRGTIDKMRATIERGLPFIYSNYGMAGATTPITPAGILALLNAELLAGLVLSQLLKEGTPVILGMLPGLLRHARHGQLLRPDQLCAQSRLRRDDDGLPDAALWDRRQRHGLGGRPHRSRQPMGQPPDELPGKDRPCTLYR